MAKFCTNCGTRLDDDVKFCMNCGIKQPDIQNSNSEWDKPENRKNIKINEPGNIKDADLDESLSPHKETIYQTDNNINYQTINRKLKIKNSQKRPVNIALLITLISAVLVVLTFLEGNPLHGMWAFTLIGIFAVLTGLVVAIIFKSRAKKMDTLISGENVIASWQLNDSQKSEFVDYLFQHENSKNKAILGITTILIAVIFGIFILVIDEGKWAMFLVMLGLIALIAVFAVGMPHYYRTKNKKSDGVVLIGKKFAYINGFFHNWDFPLSGIQKVKIIDKPFYGIFIQYYYYDRTLKNTEELYIPAPADIDMQRLINMLKRK